MKAGIALLATALLVPAVAGAKPGPDGVPSWVAAAEKHVLVSFGSPRPVAVFHIPYPNKIAVVFEFQQPTPCGLCPSRTSRPLRARVFRISFDRATHAVNGEMRLCEVRGATPPLSRCLAR